MLFPLSPIKSSEKPIYINSNHYPAIYGYYYSENTNPNPVILNNSPIQEKESIVRFPIQSQIKIYILIQNNSSYDNLEERAQREIYLMYLEKYQKISSFYENLSFYIYDSAIQEIPFPKNKLSDLPTNKSQPESSIENILSLLDSKESKLPTRPLFIVIGDGKNIPSLYQFPHPVFYLQTNNNSQQFTNTFSLHCCGGNMYTPKEKDVFSLIESTLVESNKSIHRFSFTIPWHLFLQKNTITIRQDTNSIYSTITPKWSIDGILYWVILFLFLFFIIFIFLLLIRFIQYIYRKKRETKHRIKVVSEKRFKDMSISLSVSSSNNNIKKYTFNHSFSIGSGPDCTIIIPDVTISLEHAYVKKTKKGFFIIDLQSCNGITVNNVLIDGKLLEKNDRISIGDTQILIKEILLEQNKSLAHQ